MRRSTSEERTEGHPGAAPPSASNDATTDARGPPEPPDGYRAPVPFDYPVPVLLAGVALLAIPALVGFGALFSLVQGPGTVEYLFGVTDTAEGFSFTLSLWSTVVPALLTLAVVVVAHELVHGLVYRARGYEVSYGVAPYAGAVYAAAFGQFQRRDDNLVVGVAPLLVVDAAALLLLFAPIPEVAFAAYVALVVNTTAAVGDLYLVGRLLRMPDETLLYDRDVRHMYVYYPAS